MKQAIISITAASLILFSIAACDSPSNKMENAETSVIEANRDLEIARSEVVAELEIYRAKTADKIIENNRAISSIKKKIDDEADQTVKANYEEKITALEKTHREMKREMDNYKVSGRENWDSFKDNFNDRMDEIDNALAGFFSNTSSSTQ